jgi:hypothetical protein
MDVQEERMLLVERMMFVCNNERMHTQPMYRL